MLEAAIGLLVAAAALGLRFTSFDRELEVQLWHYVTYTGATFLGIGLVRDVIIILAKGRTAKPLSKGEKLICFESVAGALLVASGLALLALEVDRAWHPALSSLGLYLGSSSW